MPLVNNTTGQGYEIDGAAGWLSGSAAPGGDTGPQDAAVLGFLYLRTDGVLYKKEASANAASDWKRVVDESVYIALGLAFDAEDFGTFTGDIISDNTDAKTALQELETELVDTRQNADDLITLSGVAENATDLGTFTGTTIVDNRDNKEALQDLETAVEAIQGGSGATDVITAATPTTIQTCLADDCNGVEVECVVHETATPATKEFFKVTILHDGTASADATQAGTKYTDFDKIKLADIAGLTYQGKITGTGGSQTVGLEISATAGITVTSRMTKIP